MIQSRASTACRPEPAFGDAEFAAIARIAASGYGLHLQAAKKPLIASRLSRRLRLLGLEDFAGYCALIEGPHGLAEREFMISALTTNVTHFFREEHHFRQLERDILPGLVARLRAGGRVRFWSAGCSTGQEPFSIAASVLALCPEALELDIRILATDVDPAVLETARAARYLPEDKGQISADRARALFGDGPGPSGRLAIREELRALVAFERLNLVDPWPMRRPFDAIFCRNVTIYFDKPVQERLWLRFADALNPGGTLFIGHSERVTGPAGSRFASTGITAYRRTGSEADPKKD